VEGEIEVDSRKDIRNEKYFRVSDILSHLSLAFHLYFYLGNQQWKFIIAD